MRQALRPHMPTGTKRRRETGADYLDNYTFDDVDDSGLVGVTWGQEGIVRARPGPIALLPLRRTTKRSGVRCASRPARRAGLGTRRSRAARDGFPATALKLGKDVRHLAEQVGRKKEPAACRIMEKAYVLLPGPAAPGRDPQGPHRPARRLGRRTSGAVAHTAVQDQTRS